MTPGRLLRLAAKLLLAGALLVAVFSKIPIAEVARVLRAADPGLFALGTALLFFMRWLAALRLRILTDAQGTQFSIAKIYEIGLIAGFYSMLLPGSLAGGAVRWYRMNRNARKPAEVLTAIVFDRLVDTLMVVVMGSAFWLFAEHRADSDLGGTLFAVVSALSATYLLAFNGRLVGLAGRVIRGLRGPRRLRDKLLRLTDAATGYRDLGIAAHSKILALSLVKDLIGVFGLLLFGRALGLDLDWVQFGWLRSLIMLIAMLPFAFSGLGVREASLALLLQPYGVDSVDAVAFSLLVFVGNLFLVLAGGLCELNHQFVRPRISADRGNER